MALDQKDLDAIESVLSKIADETAIASIGSFVRLEARIDSAESRLCNKLAAIEDRIAGAEQQIHDDVDSLGRELTD